MDFPRALSNVSLFPLIILMDSNIPQNRKFIISEVKQAVPQALLNPDLKKFIIDI